MDQQVKKSGPSALKQMALPTLCLFVVCLVATALLGMTNQVTSVIIEKRMQEEARILYQEILPEADAFKEVKLEMDGQKFVVNEGTKGADIVGYVFTTQRNGYAGPVVVLTGVDAGGSITGVDILSMQETAGLGMNAANPEFREQYVGKKGQLRVVKSDAGEDSIQALSGATVTSTAVTESVNEALRLFEHYQKGGN